jgi:hypothetical protein
LLNFISISAIKLAPKKWGMSGTSQLALVAFLGGSSFLVSQGIEIRPNLAAILALATADAIFLGGTCLAQISSFWPPHKRRILIHEAGHLLTGRTYHKLCGPFGSFSLAFWVVASFTAELYCCWTIYLNLI